MTGPLWRAVLALLAIASPIDLAYAGSPQLGLDYDAIPPSHMALAVAHSGIARSSTGVRQDAVMSMSNTPPVALASAPASRAWAVSGSSPLEFRTPSSVAVAQGKPVSLSAQASDPDGGQTLTITVSGAPAFLSLSGATGPSPLTATLSGVASHADAGTYKIVWTVRGSAEPMAAISRTTTLTVGGVALDAPQTSGASIVGYTTYGDYVVVAEGTNGINARLGVWGTVWPWAFCQQEVGYPCTDIASRIVVEIHVQTGGRLSFTTEFMQYGTPFLSDDLEAVVTDYITGVAPFWNYGNPQSCWGNLWQSPRRDISVDLSQWPGRTVFLDIYVRDCLGHQTDALAIIHSIAIRDCAVAPLAPIDPDDEWAQWAEEHPTTPDESRLTTEMKAALTCLRAKVDSVGGTLTVTSAFRTQSYQAHLRETYDKFTQLDSTLTPPECEDLKAQLWDHIHYHQMDSLKTQPASDAGLHTQGLAIDARWYSVPNIDALGCSCGLYRPLKIADKRHFVLRPCPTP